MVPEKTAEGSPPIPFRVFGAAALAAVLAGAIVYIATLGNLGAPDTETFQFSRGVALSAGEEERLQAYLLPALRDDRFVVVITGHSGTAGDPSANAVISEDRAAFVETLATDLGIDPARITAVAVGGGAPLARAEGESERSWQARLARVDVTLQLRR